ncbi:C-type lectin domain family 12 member B [Carassius carassius]|uniref:C-type lectin domain family 12 member B n=1 Tax=Carassius carassius TaxID=217509 RepID=UPI0028689B43|nr:C-type lectin domain family 12 member B [Carassius carassius]
MTPQCGHRGLVNVQLLKALVHSGALHTPETLTLDVTHTSRSIGIRKMEREGAVETITDVNRDARFRHNVRTETENTDTKRHQTLQHAGSGCVKVRSSRSAVVCLVLLCVLLLTAVIVLGVNLHDMIEEFYIKNKNITDEIEELKKRKSNLASDVTNLSDKNETLFAKNETLHKEMKELWLKISKMDGWKCNQSSLYYVSSEMKNWRESRRDCKERGSDLIIINNKEEQDFVKTDLAGSEFWIGLTEVESTWKWVDDSLPITELWASGKPSDSSGNKDCAVNLSSGFAEYSCDQKFKWICEKNI